MPPKHFCNVLSLPFLSTESYEKLLSVALFLLLSLVHFVNMRGKTALVVSECLLESFMSFFLRHDL